MNREKAKMVLAIYRPGTHDDEDPEIAAARELAGRDPELARWLEEHNALHAAVRAKFRQLAVHPGLREKIIAEYPGKIVWWRRPASLAMAAAVVMLIGLVASWLLPREHHAFATYRNRMVRTAMQNYGMNLLTNDLAQIRSYLAANGGHAGYRLSAPLEQLPGDGCAILRWHDRKVSLVCFDLGNQRDLYLFIINRDDLSDAPATREPQFARVGRLITASWTHGDKTYLLAGPGDEEFLRKFL